MPRPIRPSPENLERLAPVLGMAYESLLEVCGYLPETGQADTPKPPISIQQRTLAQNYERWMAVMGPRMGTQAAHDAYWDPLVRNISQTMAAVETMLGGLLTPPDSTAVRDVGSAAVDDVVNQAEAIAKERPEDGGGPLTRI
jgi:hypothetical protein